MTIPKDLAVTPLRRKTRQFLNEIEAVCRKHGMQLTSSGYDGLQVWDLKRGEHPLFFNSVADRTAAKGKS